MNWPSDYPKVCMDKMLSSCPLFIVPPFIGDKAVPNLGIAIIESEMRALGISYSMIDMNIEFINSGVYGDPKSLSPANRHERFTKMLTDNGIPLSLCEYSWRAWCNHEEMRLLVDILSRENCPFRELVIKTLRGLNSPLYVAIAVCVPQQVVLALAIARIAKQMWSEPPIILGGAHIDLLEDQIKYDSDYRSFFDFYVTRQNRTALTKCVNQRIDETSGLCLPGSGKNPVVLPCPPHVMPVFSSVNMYTSPVIPFSLSSGCSYARCTFCTRPIAEGKQTGFDYQRLEDMIKLCQDLNGVLWFIDCDIPPFELERISDIIKGRVSWKCYLRVRGDWCKAMLMKASSNGLKSVEIGIEALDDDTQVLFDKKISIEDVAMMLQALGSTPIKVDVNYIINSPCRDKLTESRDLELLKYYGNKFCGEEFTISKFPLEIYRNTKLWREAEKNGIKILREFYYSNTCEWVRR